VMGYGPGFGLPDLMSPISDIRQAVADLSALPKEPFTDGQLTMLRETLKIAEKEEAAGRPTGPFKAPSTPRTS
jgi:hypothetical protein